MVEGKSPVESVLGFIERQQERRDDKKRQEQEAAAAAAREAEERARIEREKSLAFMRKYWWALLAALAVLVAMIYVGDLNEPNTTAPAPIATGASSDAKTDEPSAAATAGPTEQELADRALESSFPVENAKRAAVVAMTNAMAIDVFTSDGNSYDPAKFHSYSDTSGKVEDYFLDVSSWGTWSAKGERSWHVDSLTLSNRWDTNFDCSLDVTHDGARYLISNVTVTRDDATDPSGMSEDGPCYSIPAELIEKDRS